MSHDEGVILLLIGWFEMQSVAQLNPAAGSPRVGGYFQKL